jgi:single-strand DNA-binding protein
MFSLNRIQLIGYQTQPVSVRQTPSGMSVTDLNLVVPYIFKGDNGQAIEGKSFHVVTVWGSMATVAGQFLKPGGQVFVSGRLQTDSWEDPQSGEKRSKTKIVAMDMILLDPRDGQTQPPAGLRQLTNCLNRADVVGNVTREPELRTTTSGQKVLTLGVATNERWKDKASNEVKERSEFHSIVIWGDLADEVQKAVHKGSRVFASGRVQTRSFETQAGQKRYATEIVADSVSLLGISNPAALAAVQADASLPREKLSTSTDMSAFGEEAGASPLPAPLAGVGASGIPPINYGGSEIKVEDLPF